MVAYKFYANEGIKEFRLLGILPERRKDPLRITYDSILNWGKLIVSNCVDINNIYFIQIEVQEGSSLTLSRQIIESVFFSKVDRVGSREKEAEVECLK
jgi:hypothetical protein